MFQKFFTDTIESKFIKALLEKTPIPMYPSISTDGYAINGLTYTSKYGIIRCTKTGKLDSNFVRLYPYIFGQSYPQFTEKYFSKYNYYDTDTHETLGKYLRVYRDLYGIDLMPFYNCFSYRIFEDIYLTSNKHCGYEIGNNKNYKLFAIPICFDKIYTVVLDSQSPVTFKAVLHDNIGHLITSGTDDSEAIELLKDCPVIFEFNDSKEIKNNDGVTEIPYTSYGNPVKFEIKIDSNVFTDAYKRKLKSLEKYLYLVVQVSSNNSSSIIALEGDYDNGDINTNFYNIENINNAIENIIENGSNFIRSNIAESTDSSDAFDTIIKLLDRSLVEKSNNFMLTDLSLLKMGTANVYAFNNRLVEYLLLNVVDSEDTIDDNTIKVQKILDLFNRKDIAPSAWNNVLRFTLFKKFMEKNSESYDINGFIDKDVEKMLIEMDGDY